MALQTATITGNIKALSDNYHNAPINVKRTSVNPIPGEETTLVPNFSATFYTDENGDIAFTLAFDDDVATNTNYELTLPLGDTYPNTVTGDTTIADWIASSVTPPLPEGVFVPVQSLGTAIVRADGGISGDPRGANAVDLQRLLFADDNVASGAQSVIMGGAGNSAPGESSVVAGGLFNNASGDAAVVAGGTSGEASGLRAVIGGGDSNEALGDYATVGGGLDNKASGNISTVAGGFTNVVNGFSSVIAGGSTNSIDGDFGAVVGGRDNVIQSEDSVVMGRNMFLQVGADRLFVIGTALTPVTFEQPDAFITYALRAFMSAPSSAPTDADMKNGSISFWIDETNNLLIFRVRYSDGSYQTGEVPFSKSAVIETISAGRDWTDADNGKVFQFDASVTMNSPDGLVDGWQVALNNLTGANTITFTAATTLNGEGGLTTINGDDFARATLYHETANVHYLGGNLA